MTKTIDTTQLGQELEQAALDPGRKGIIDLIRRNKDELQKLLGDTLTVDQFETATMTYLRMNPKLVECNPYGIVGGLRLGAQLGLSLGPLGHFYLVPFKQEAVFILGYRGMIELAYRSDKVKDVRAGIVRMGDSFTYTYGTHPQLHHTPSGPPGEREWTHVYAVARLKTTGTPFVVLYPEDVEKRRQASAAKDSPYSIWQTHTEDAWLKSSVRALQRWIPQTRDSSAGLAQDEAVVDALTDEPGDAPTDEDDGS